MDFENLYVRTMQYLQTLSRSTRPMLGIGDMTSYRLLISSNRVTAVMLYIENGNAIPQEQKENGSAMPLEWVLDNTPKSLEDAVVSWVIFKHELNPTTILIHSDLGLEEIRELCYTRLVSETARSKRRAELEEALQKAKEIANEAYISEGKPKRDFLAHAV